MATFMVSFRIAQLDNHSERYDGLNAAILSASSGNYWDETTSFYVLESDLSISTFINYLKAEINPQYDTVLVRSLDSKTAFIAGVVRDGDIFTLMPYLKKA